MPYLILLALLAIGLVVAVLFCQQKHRLYVAGGFVGAMTLLSVMFSITVIPAGHVGVPVSLGSVGDEVYPNGFHFVSPEAEIVEYSVKRQTVDLQQSDGQSGSDGGQNVATSEGVRGMSNDRVSVWIDMDFPFRLNREFANFLYANVGDKETYKSTLMVPAARSALKDAVADMGWYQATVSDRDAFARQARQDFVQKLENDLVEQGMTASQASKVFTVLPVKFRNHKIPDKLSDSIEERKAAEEDLKREKILTQKAKKEAERRAEEGQGIANFLNKLPDTHSPAQIAQLLQAQAGLIEARGWAKAVERDQVQVIAVPATGQGGANTALQLPESLKSSTDDLVSKE